MGISGIVVATRTEHVAGVLHALGGMPGVDAHQVDHASGRIVLTQEAADIEAHTTGLKRIKDVPHVLFAELVYHYVGEGREEDDTGPSTTPAPPRPAQEDPRDLDD